MKKFMLTLMAAQALTIGVSMPAHAGVVELNHSATAAPGAAVDADPSITVNTPFSGR